MKSLARAESWCPKERHNEPWHAQEICLHSTTRNYYYYGSTTLCWALAIYSVSWSYTQTVGLLEWGIRQSQGRYLHTAQHKHTRQTTMPWVGFESTIPAFERVKTVHAFDRAATVMGRTRTYTYTDLKFCVLSASCYQLPHWCVTKGTTNISLKFAAIFFSRTTRKIYAKADKTMPNLQYYIIRFRVQQGLVYKEIWYKRCCVGQCRLLMSEA
jgi:hypothetical protein